MFRVRKTRSLGVLTALVTALAMVAVSSACEGSGGRSSPDEAMSAAAANPAVRFGDPQRVDIIGYDGHAMEPFISRDGNVLFFNSLNDGVDTSLYFATRVDDASFQFHGEVGGVNGDPPHLDAVASVDVEGRIYWVSTRDYPAVYENLQTGRFGEGRVTGVAPVPGDFYVRKPGWIVMDAEINPDGKVLFFVNARFAAGEPVPEESRIGVAQRTDEGFFVDRHSDVLLAAVNEGGLSYAPAFSLNGLELYFTRLENADTAVYVSTRASLDEPFGTPQLLMAGGLAEAPSISADGRSLYFHRQEAEIFRIYRMLRDP